MLVTTWTNGLEIAQWFYICTPSNDYYYLNVLLSEMELNPFPFDIKLDNYCCNSKTLKEIYYTCNAYLISCKLR